MTPQKRPAGRVVLVSRGRDLYHDLMQRLVAGAHAFRAQYFAGKRDLFRKLERGQTPDALFITCSDSRVVPHLITGSEPGDLFIVRNVANVVPHPTLPGGTAAAIEYAIEVLGISNIVVCGHTDCGGIRAVLEPERMEQLPFVRRWLSQAERVREIVRERYAHLEGTARITAAVEENVLVQLENLRAFPFIADKLDRGDLRLSGWVYRIATGEMFAYDPSQEQFVEIGQGSVPPPPPDGTR